MSRAVATYREADTAVQGTGYSVETPTAGFYRFRMVSGGFPVAVRVWNGPPYDPETGEIMDRSWRWQATVNGAAVDLDRVWPACGRDPIDEAEHDHLCAVAAWAKDHAPHSPQADPRKPVNRLTAPLLI